MEKKEYTGFWMPEWTAALKCRSLPERFILARVWSLREKGAWLTSKTMGEQLGLHATHVRHITTRLVKAGWLLSEPFANGLRILHPGPLLVRVSTHEGCVCQAQGCAPQTQGCVCQAHRDYSKITYENTKNTCPAEPGPPHSSQTNPDPNPEIVCSKNGSGSENQAVPRRAAAFDAYDEDDVEWALDVCTRNVGVAFPELAALGLLERKENDRRGH